MIQKKGCYFGETNQIIDNKINKMEKGIINDFKKRLKKTEDKNKKEELLELIKLYEKPATSHEKRVEEVVTQTVVEEKIVKKAEPKVKNPFIFKTEPYRKDYSRLIYWCNAFEPINKGKLASSQGWKREKPERSYY